MSEERNINLFKGGVGQFRNGKLGQEPRTYLSRPMTKKSEKDKLEAELVERTLTERNIVTKDGERDKEEITTTEKRLGGGGRRGVGEVIREFMVVFCVFLINFLTAGFSIAMGAYYVTFLEVFQRGHGVTSWIGSLNFAMLCLIGPVASVVIGRCGCAWTFIAGGGIAGVGLIITSFAQSLDVIFISHGVITGCGYGLCFTTAVVCINNEFNEERRAFAMGLSISGVGVGACIYPFLFTILTETYGWRGALLISGGLTFHCCLAGVLLRSMTCRANHGPTIEMDIDTVPDSFDDNCNFDYCDSAKACDNSVINSDAPPNPCDNHSLLKDCDRDEVIQVKDSENYLSYVDVKRQDSTFESVTLLEEKVDKEKESENSDQLMKKRGNKDKNVGYCSKPFFTNPHYWLLHLNCIFYCFGQSVVFTHIMAYGETVGLSYHEGAALLSSIGFASIGGRIFLGAVCSLAPGVNVVLLLSLCYVTAGCAVCLCMSNASFIFLVVLMLTFGFTSAAYGPVLCEVVCHIASVKHFGSAYGVLLISMGTGTLIGAPIAGEIYDRTEVYANSIYLGSVALLAGGLVVLPSWRLISRLQSDKNLNIV